MQTSWTVWARATISLLIVLHVASLLAHPLWMFSQSSVKESAADMGMLRRFLAPYVEMMYLDHGYFFFAPNPGPNHLVEVHLLPKDDPSKKESFRFPDRKVHWPRLYYHRHFMLSEFYHNTFTFAEQPPEAVMDREIDRQWRSRLAIHQKIRESIVGHVQSQHPESDIQIKRIEHQLPNEFRVFVERWPLDDVRLYVEMPETVPAGEDRAGIEGGQRSPEKVVFPSQHRAVPSNAPSLERIPLGGEPMVAPPPLPLPK